MINQIKNGNYQLNKLWKRLILEINKKAMVTINWQETKLKELSDNQTSKDMLILQHLP